MNKMRNITITLTFDEIKNNLKIQATCEKLEKHEVVYFLDELKEQILSGDIMERFDRNNGGYIEETINLTNKMTIDKIKIAMLNHRDFFGGDIMYTDEIKKAKTKKDLSKIMDNYGVHLETMAIDAQRHHDNFKKKLGLILL